MSLEEDLVHFRQANIARQVEMSRSSLGKDNYYGGGLRNRIAVLVEWCEGG